MRNVKTAHVVPVIVALVVWEMFLKDAIAKAVNKNG